MKAMPTGLYGVTFDLGGDENGSEDQKKKHRRRSRNEAETGYLKHILPMTSWRAGIHTSYILMGGPNL
jgi:hypothetical protein